VECEGCLGDCYADDGFLMVVCLESEKHVERMSAFTYNHERRS
jgi:hypothetical protein